MHCLPFSLPSEAFLLFSLQCWDFILHWDLASVCFNLLWLIECYFICPTVFSCIAEGERTYVLTSELFS
jgi:hypothetical protein